VDAPRREEVLPHSRESECALLGSLIFDQSKVDAVREIVQAEDFSFPAHQAIYQALLFMRAASRSIDLVLLRDELAKAGKLDALGGADYLVGLVEGVPNAERALEYAASVRAFSRQRKALAAYQVLGVALRSGHLNGEYRAFQDAVAELDADSKPEHEGPKPLAALRVLAAQLAEVEPVPASIHDLNEPLRGGYRPGWLVVAGAFTAGGKTTFCVREAVHKATLDHPVLYVSCELGAVELARKVDLATAEEGQTPPDLPIWVDDTVTDLPAVISCIQGWVESRDSGKCPLVILDYLQRVRAGAQVNREREVAIVAEELQKLARRLGIILVAAAQLNRQSQSDDKPSLHHLRESGLIEQVADVALLLTKTGPDRLRVGLGKNRWGSSGQEIELSVDFARARIGSLTEGQQAEPLARAVVEHLRAHGGRVKISKISASIKVPGRRDHPRVDQIVAAGLSTRLYSVGDGEAFLT